MIKTLTIRYGRDENGNFQVRAANGSVRTGGDAWTFLTNILRHNIPLVNAWDYSKWDEGHWE